MKPTWQSQAGQDRFVAALVDGPGTFLDVGCGHPVERNNTWALEQMGWHGLLVDSDAYVAKLCHEQRQSPMLQVDTTTLNWRDAIIVAGLTEPIDYLSLDVDAASLATLVALGDVKFRVLTVEHDAYRFGTVPRQQMRAILLERGYVLIAADVHDSGCAFEDWWVSPDLVLRAAPFCSSGKDWAAIVR